MKGRESGMPPQEVWEAFFQPSAILTRMGLDARTHDVAEFGCGYGTFTLPAARVVTGTVYAIDIDTEMVAHTQQEAAKAGLRNITTIFRDVLEQGTGLPGNAVDYVMLFNILHVEHPDILLHEARRILRMHGTLGIMHWNYDRSTPRGPSMAIRPTPHQCFAWAMVAGFRDPQQYELPPYHFGIVLRKEAIQHNPQQTNAPTRKPSY